MSRGRRKKNSVSLSTSSRTSSRESLRWRYPASVSIWLAGSDSEPLFGTAMRSMATCLGGSEGRDGLQMSVDVLEREPLAQHQDLNSVQQLADLLGGAVCRLVLSGHPRLRGLFDDLLALGVHAGVEGLDGRRTRRALTLTVGEFGEQLVEAFHRALEGIRRRHARCSRQGCRWP